MLAKKYRFPIQYLPPAPAAVQKSRYFTVKTFSSLLPYGRFGIVISKKIIPKASERSRIKRIIFNSLQSKIKERAGSDTLIIVNSATGSASGAKDVIINELKKLL